MNDKEHSGTEYEKRLIKEIESGIKEMESEAYEFPKRFSGKDFVFTAVVILLCLGGVIFGAFLV